MSRRRQVEAGTPFARWQAAGRLTFPDDEAGADMYRDASNMLREVPICFSESCCCPECWLLEPDSLSYAHIWPRSAASLAATSAVT